LFYLHAVVSMVYQMHIATPQNELHRSSDCIFSVSKTLLIMITMEAIHGLKYNSNKQVILVAMEQHYTKYFNIN